MALPPYEFYKTCSGYLRWCGINSFVKPLNKVYYNNGHLSGDK